MRRSGLICLARSSRTGLDMSHILFMVEILLLTLDRKSGSAGMPRPISYAVFCLKKKTAHASPGTAVRHWPELRLAPPGGDQPQEQLLETDTGSAGELGG